MEDDDLLKRVEARDNAALEALAQRHGRGCYALALRVVGDPESAEEVVQDALVRLWWSAGRLHTTGGTIKPWLLRVTRNRAIEVVRSRRARFKPQLTDPTVTSPSDPADEVVRRIRDQALMRSLQQLSPEQREVVMLAYYRGMTHSELAATLELPLGTVKTRLRLGLAHLRQALRDREEVRDES